ncbi:MAG: beta-ketoacyl-[acyl-carrier-protein] synthase family protein [Flavobacteriales bacterium]|nr:beta-ketoacyl-[acyl-carrier-protein] synthase family protein [Flavobacteriales bacterium]
MGRVVVTGIGVISAIGNNVAENHHSLRAGRTGIGKAQYLNSKYAELLLFGEVKLSNDELKDLLGVKTPLLGKEGLGVVEYNRTELLALKAFKEAIESAGLTKKELHSFETAFLSGTTVGGMVEMEAIHADANSNTEPSPFVNSYRSGAHTERLAEHFGLRGYTDTMNTACSSSANSIMLGARLIKAGKAKRAIVGGVDSLAKYTVNGFNSLQIFSDEITRPFDANRKGLNLGEGAAYLVLEREEDAVCRNIWGEVRGYGNSNDAFHPSSMSPEAVGVRGAINGALETADLKPEYIQHVNAHGTGTENNDYTEVHGMQQVFGQIPPYVSTKSYTGHTLAAAGAIEAVYSLLSVANQEIYPTLNWQTQMPEFNSKPQTEFCKAKIDHVLSNSFGFGGNCSSLILSKV